MKITNSRKYLWIVLVLVIVLSGCAKTQTYTDKSPYVDEKKETSLPDRCSFGGNVICTNSVFTNTTSLTLDLKLWNRGPHYLFNIFIVPNDAQANCTPNEINPVEMLKVDEFFEIHCTDIVGGQEYLNKTRILFNVSARPGSKMANQTIVGIGEVYGSVK